MEVGGQLFRSWVFCLFITQSLVSAVTAYVHSQPIPLSPLLSPHESARVMAVSHQIQLFILWVALLKLGTSGITPAGVSLAHKIFLNSPW